VSAALLPWDLIKETANRYDLEPSLVAAVCLIESDGNPWANRVEFKRIDGGWKSRWRYYLNPIAYARRIVASVPTETINQATSWGLMQVMGAVAREHGFKGWLPELCDPATGIEYGCRHLSKFVRKYNSVALGLQAYNAGHPTTAGARYARKVLDRHRELRRA
jgi:soluble lytic murein transglycosylase-like protein